MSAEPNLVFTTAVPAQLAEVDNLIRTAFTPYVRGLGREIAPDAYGWFPEAIAAGNIYIALDGEEIVGAIATRIRDRDMELAMIGVSPARQKSGIASFMIRRVMQAAKSRGMRTLSLNTAEMMEDRVRLYRRHGFVIASVGPPDHGKDPHMRVFMMRSV